MCVNKDTSTGPVPPQTTKPVAALSGHRTATRAVRGAVSVVAVACGILLAGRLSLETLMWMGSVAVAGSAERARTLWLGASARARARAFAGDGQVVMCAE